MTSVGYRLHGLLHGLQVLSPFDLPERLRADVDPAHAIVVHDLGEGPVPAQIPDNPELALTVNGHPTLTLHRDADQWQLRCPGWLSFSISDDLRQIWVLRSPEAEREFVPMLLAGAALAMVATLADKVVLHASAISTSRGVVAFAGPSGQGKSTVATLAALAGAPLFADDVLAVDLGDPVMAHRGVTVARLREGSQALAEISEVPHTEQTVDGRLAVQLPQEAELTMPLAAIVMPVQTKDAKQVSLKVLDPAAAFQTLARCMRLNGWRTAERQRRAIADTAALAGNTPVALATIPSGESADAGIGEQLLETLEALETV